MAKKKGKRKAKRGAHRASAPAVTIRYANPGAHHMARKKKKKGGHHHRRNPSNPKRGHHRRRRNPGDGFMSRAGRLAGAALVALGTGALVTVATAKIAPGNPLSLYGIPAGTFLAGAAIAKKAPTIGGGMALGAFAPFAVPVGSQILSMTSGQPASTTAAGIARAYRSMRAIDMGAIDMGDPSRRGIHGGWAARANEAGHGWAAVGSRGG